MLKFEFCLPTTGKIVPAGADWFHEIKYDGYRLRLERDGDHVRLITKGGHDGTGRYSWIDRHFFKAQLDHLSDASPPL